MPGWHDDKSDSSSLTLTQGDTTTNYIGTEQLHSNELESTKQQLKLAGLRIIELKDAYAREYARAQTEKERADNFLDVFDIIDPDEELISLREQLQTAGQEKDTALKNLDRAQNMVQEAVDEAKHLRDEVTTTRARNQHLVIKLQKARDAAESINQNVVDELHATIRVRDAKVEQLTAKNDGLSANQHASQETIKNLNVKLEKACSADTGRHQAVADQLRTDVASRDAEIKKLITERDIMQATMKRFKNDLDSFKKTNIFLTAKNENLQSDLDESHAKVVRAVKDHDETRQDLIRTLKERPGRPDDSNGVTTKVEDDLRRKNKALENRINTLRTSMAYNITQLDANLKGWRMYNCKHAHYRDIPDGYNSSQDCNIQLPIFNLLQDWWKEKEFVKEYNYHRRTTISHHRAHEKANHGNAVISWLIKTEFQREDNLRGIPIRY